MMHHFSLSWLIVLISVLNLFCSCLSQISPLQWCQILLKSPSSLRWRYLTCFFMNFLIHVLVVPRFIFIVLAFHELSLYHHPLLSGKHARQLNSALHEACNDHGINYVLIFCFCCFPYSDFYIILHHPTNHNLGIYSLLNECLLPV